MENITRYRDRIGTIPNSGPRSTSSQSVVSIHYWQTAHLFLYHRPRRTQFWEWLHKRCVSELVYTAGSAHMKLVLCEGVFVVRNSHIWARDNPYYLVERGYQVHFSVKYWSGIVGDTVVGPCLLTYRLTAQRLRNFLETIQPWLLENISLMQNLWFQHDWAPARYRKDFRQPLNAAYPGRWSGRGGSNAWPLQSPDLNPVFFFFCEAPEEALSWSLCQDYRISSGRISCICNNIFTSVRGNSARRSAACL